MGVRAFQRLDLDSNLIIITFEVFFPLQIKSLHGNSASIIDFSKKLKAFQMKLISWKEKYYAVDTTSS